MKKIFLILTITIICGAFTSADKLVLDTRLTGIWECVQGPDEARVKLTFTFQKNGTVIQNQGEDTFYGSKLHGFMTDTPEITTYTVDTKVMPMYIDFITTNSKTGNINRREKGIYIFPTSNKLKIRI